jgi:hypothetical protein
VGKTRAFTGATGCATRERDAMHLATASQLTAPNGFLFQYPAKFAGDVDEFLAG